LKALKRNHFPQELFWSQHACSGFIVSNQTACVLRKTDELKLVSYTPEGCLTGDIPNCDELIAYSRVSVKATSQ
jgi:hypothetical protein